MGCHARPIDTDEDTLLVNQAVLAASAQRYLVADSSKYGRYSVYSVCKLQQLDGVITDDDCPVLPLRR